MDLAFRDKAAAEGAPDRAVWTVVDFKTDLELASRKAEYEVQLRLYVAAVSAATGEPARGVLLVV